RSDREPSPCGGIPATGASVAPNHARPDREGARMIDTEAIRPSPVEGEDPRRWFALAAIAAAQFMVVLDIAIVNVALPSIQRALPGGAVDPHHELPGRARAQRRPGRLGRGGWERRGGGDAAGRRAHLGPRMVVDLLRQRPAGHLAVPPDAGAAPGEPGRPGPPTVRLRRRVLRDRRPDAAGLRDDPGHAGRVVGPTDDRRAGRCRDPAGDLRREI